MDIVETIKNAADTVKEAIVGKKRIKTTDFSEFENTTYRFGKDSYGYRLSTSKRGVKVDLSRVVFNENEEQSETVRIASLDVGEGVKLFKWLEFASLHLNKLNDQEDSGVFPQEGLVLESPKVTPWHPEAPKVTQEID